MRSSLLLSCLALLPLATACGMFTGVDSGEVVGSGSGDDAGTDDSGRRDAGSSRRDSGTGGGGTSTPDSGNGGGGGGGVGALGAQCTALQNCCSTLDPSIASSCDDAVSGKVESTCASTLTSYKSDGYCGGTVTPPPPVDAGGLVGDPCTTLLACCLGTGTTASADPSCVNTALAAVASACLSEYHEDVAFGICN